MRNKPSANTFISIMLIVMVFFFSNINCQSTIAINTVVETDSIIVGAQHTNLYLSKLQGKKIAIIANPSSLVCKTHLVDTLLSLGIDIKKVMSPEHGFRGNVGAGEHVDNEIDKKTGLSIISLYGNHKKPTNQDLKDIDILIFDLQDVGTRFYTYLSTLHLCMEACAENNKEFIVLDRPNPNGYYVDGPVLEKKNSSFVGMDPIPIVHGMTLGEYAQMLNGEYWLADSLQCKLTIIPVENYDHKMNYNLPVPPSPNLPNAVAINLYPSLCLFEGTCVSIGRGTETPFQVYGYPTFKRFNHMFTPKPIAHAAPSPKLNGEICFGYDLSNYKNDSAFDYAGINLDWLIDAYAQMEEKDKFFNSFFTKLAGTKLLREQIESGMSSDEIKASWQSELLQFKKIRSKYLIYPDFE